MNWKFNPLNTIADDVETERKNATDLSDEAQPREVTENINKPNYSLGDVRRRLPEQELTD